MLPCLSILKPINTLFLPGDKPSSLGKSASNFLEKCFCTILLKQSFNSFLEPLHPGNTGASSMIIKFTSSIISSPSSISTISSTSTASFSSVSVDSITVSSTSFSSSTTSIFSGAGGGGVFGFTGSTLSVIGISSSIIAFIFAIPKLLVVLS